MDSDRGSIKQFISLCLLGFILYPTLLLALTLTWNPSPQRNSNYRLYYGSQSLTYTNAVDTGTNLSVAINTVEGVSYYAAVVAYDPIAKLESNFSKEAAFVPTTNTVYHLTIRVSADMLNWTNYAVLDITNNQPQAFYNLTISK